MSTPLFRQSALQRLSSPEQLDQLMHVTRPRAWIGLYALAAVLTAVLLWGIFGSLPTRISGQGVVIREGGVLNVAAQAGGTVASYSDLRLGQRVRAGQLIAVVGQPLLELQVDAARSELERLRLERKALADRFMVEQPAQGEARRLQRLLQEGVIRAREEQLESLRTVESQQVELLRDGLITRQRHEETRQAIFGAETEIGNARSALQRLALEQLSETSRRAERERELDARVEQAVKRLRELERQLSLSSQVLAPMDGTVVEVMAMRGDLVKPGQPVLSIETERTELRAMVFMPPDSSAELIQTGMAAQISPVTAKKERYGSIIGRVRGVARYPATEQGMMAVFNNELLVRELSKAGPPIAVDVELVPDASTRSGYRWSSSTGASVELRSGTLCSGTFVIQRERPIGLVIPLLRETLGL